MVDDDAVAGPHIDVRPAAGRLDDFAEVVGVKKPGGKVRAADLRGRVAYRLAGVARCALCESVDEEVEQEFE
jgi:hypothetical protein